MSAKIELILVALGRSTQMVTAGTWSASSLATTNACWVQISLCRREGFCFLERDQEVTSVGATDTSWRALSPAVADELLMLSLNIRSWGTDLRTTVSQEIFCTDASGDGRPGVGATSTQMPAALVQDLWCHRVRRGGYVRKESAAEAAARRVAESFDDDDFVDGDVASVMLRL